MRQITLRIYGLVQGVFFRQHAKKVARSLNLTGWILNEDDGSVTCVIEGDDKSLEFFIAFAKQGPEGATVFRVQIDEKSINKREFNSFRIINN